MRTSTDGQDNGRLARLVRREGLISIMNETKWIRLRELMVGLGGASPLFRVRCLRPYRAHGDYWDGDWFYHLPDFKGIEWLEIDPIQREHRGELLEDAKTDRTPVFVDLLKQNDIPFSIQGEFIRVWGYQRPGERIEFA